LGIDSWEKYGLISSLHPGPREGMWWALPLFCKHIFMAHVTYSSQIIHFIKIHSSRTNLLQAVTKKKVHTLATLQQRNITAGQTENCCEWSEYLPGS